MSAQGSILSRFPSSPRREDSVRHVEAGALGLALLLVPALAGCSDAPQTEHAKEDRMPDRDSARKLTPEQRAMVATWERHTASEFQTADIDATMATMTEAPHVNHVPVMTGGVGREGVRRFYTAHFIGRHPPDTEVELVSRTVGRSRIVDELVHSFTHSIEMPWILPGIAPTAERVELPVVAIVEFDEEGRIAHEHIYWDQASVLAQIGLLDTTELPVVGAAQARKVLDPALPPNELIERGR